MRWSTMIKRFIKDVGIFIAYLLIQPAREIYNLLIVSTHKGRTIAYLSAWRFPLLAATILFYAVGNSVMTKVSGALLIISIIKTEWDEKRWLNLHRERRRKKIEKKLKQEKSEDQWRD